MDDSVRLESPPAAGNGSVERRSVRRRLVQSTLFPTNSQVTEPNGDRKKDNNCSEDEAGNEDEDAACTCSSQKGKRRRKGRTATPQKKKEKLPVNGTPTKGGRKLTSPIKPEDRSSPIPNLRLEAKLMAEENSRMFSGRQIHPFFSSRKLGKKSEEATEFEGGIWSSRGKNKGVTLGPVHVFEKPQDDERLDLDWRYWTFTEDGSIDSVHNSERPVSVFEGNLSPFTFDKLPYVSYTCHESLLQNGESLCQRPNQERCLRETSADLAAHANEHVLFCLLSKDSDLHHDSDRVGLISTHAESLGNLDLNRHGNFPQERTITYHVDSGNKPANMLWTDKFQPRRSTEVCGNDDSIKFLTDWLHLWRQRHHQNCTNLDGADGSRSLDNSSSYHLHDSDAEYTEDGEGLKNVLLVIGPVGSGKSAAIYACAEEQGFDVMEVNASECRNGSLVKQRFGEALESQWLKWSSGNDLDPQEHKCNTASPNGRTEPVLCNGVIQISDEDTSYNAFGAKVFDSKENGSLCEQRNAKPLILFEDVDITFFEDRGFISAVEQIADTAKGPLVLTTNNSSIALPDSLDRLEMSFALPSQVELLRHVYMVCASEKVNVHPQIIERFVECFKGDIRKTLLHLQFWCQGNRSQKDENVRRMDNAELFDLESIHTVLPTLMPWSFLSELSEIVEKEIANSFSAMEETNNLEVVEEEFDEEVLVSSFAMMDQTELDLEAKKDAMLSLNCSVDDDRNFATETISIPCDYSSSPGTSVAFSRPKGRRKGVILSSDSEDETESRIPCFSGHQQSFLIQSPCKQTEGKLQKEEFCFFPCSGIQVKSDIDDRCRASTEDVSCVPESTYVPETAIEDETDSVSCRTISSSPQVVKTEEGVTGNEPANGLNPTQGKILTRLRKLSDLPRTTNHVTAECYKDEEVTQHEHSEAIERTHHVMDECSRMDFRRRSVSNMACESWKRLRAKDLKNYVSVQEKDAMRITRLASRMSDLISYSDLLLSKCGAEMSDSLDPRAFTSEEPEFFGWCDEQWHISSTMFQHGFCSYAKDIANIGATMNLDYSQKRVDLTSEILSLTRDKMALGKMVLGDTRESCSSVGVGMNQKLNPHNRDDTSRSEARSSLFDVVQSLIPPRTHFSLRGDAFHEYLSSLGNISRVETTRLSQGVDKTKRRRGRESRHYLSTGTLMMSPEDISLLDRFHVYRNSISQSTEPSNRLQNWSRVSR